MSHVFGERLRLNDLTFLSNELLEIITCYSGLLNCHMVDFITEDHWSLVLDEELKREVEVLGLGSAEQHIFDILCCHGNISSISCPSLNRLVKKITEFNLDSIAYKIPHQTEFERNSLDQWWMKQKKNHEVQFFTELISSVAKECQADTVVDFGCGKGYLSTLLTLRHNLKVFGLDSSQTNTQNAQARHGKLASAYDRVDKKRKETENNSCMPDVAGQFITVTECVNADTNLERVLCRWLDRDQDQRFLLCGLHTCGDLGATVVRQFASIHSAKSLCYVGCCYHLVQEEFCTNPFSKETDSVNENWSFPLSLHLRQQEARLGRNARMLASQSWPRIASSGFKSQNCALFYRAVLQAILKDLGVIPEPEQRVGRLAAKCSDFTHYFKRAVQKLKVPNITLSDEEIERHFHKYKDYESKLNVFQGLRVILAPAVEAIVILDRIIYLLENENTESCHLYKVFDPKISPRCYAIVAFKEERK